MDRAMHRPLRFAFFDLDDTLVDTEAALHAWSLDFVAEYGLGGDGSGNDVEAVAEAAALAVNRRAHSVASWREFTERARDWYGIATAPQELFEQLTTTYTRKFTVADEATSGLTRLRQAGWLLGIVTNGSTIVQHRKIDHVGLRGYVDVVVDSETAGYRKPDRRILELAAGKLGVELGPDGWMVGDMLDKDVEGGIAAGLHTIWLPHGRVLGAGDPRPEHAAATIGEAIAIIEASADAAPAGGPANME
jgi:HAD superfamily hydrolase (TIGR01549 family)